MSWVAAGVAAFSIVSGAQQAETIRDNARLSKEINEFNSESALIDAYHAELEGDSMVARYERDVTHTIADQKVANAVNDVDSSFGTAADLISETKLIGYLNATTIKNQASAKAQGYIDQARNYRLGGGAAYAESMAKANATQNAALIGGIGSFASSKSVERTVSGYQKGKK